MSELEDLSQYKVVLNQEEQYSIWPADKENALGWSDEGFRGSKPDVLAYIKEHWTDMRPRSLRMQMDTTFQSAMASADIQTNEAAVATVTRPDVIALPATADTDENTGEKLSKPNAEVANQPQKRGWLFGLFRSH